MVPRFKLTSFVALDVQNGELTKHTAVLQCREHGFPVISDHTELSSFNNVHLLPDVPLAADVVAWTEHL